MSKAWFSILISVSFPKWAKLRQVSRYSTTQMITMALIALARREMGIVLPSSVVLDDAAQNITHVVRGE
jgi:glutamyl/glutaminyl-tRNA synthetase